MVDRFFDGGLEERIEGWIDRGREIGRELVSDVAGGPRRRRPLEAISRRMPRPSEPVRGWSDGDDEWPDDELFNLPRWQRSEPARPAPQDPLNSPPPQAADRTPRRPLPRSSRRRSAR